MNPWIIAANADDELSLVKFSWNSTWHVFTWNLKLCFDSVMVFIF